MNVFAVRLAAACCATAAMIGATAVTSEAPPPAHTGGFGEPTCQTCHFEREANAGSGRLTIDGVPASYVPGETYTLSVALVQAGMKTGGFQLSVRSGGGAQAGTLRMTGADSTRGSVTVDGGVQYAHHVLAGTKLSAPDSVRWTVDWTAPAHGDVVFHAAANAANDDSSPLGDDVYVIVRRSAPK